MISCDRTHGSRQPISNKSIREEYKILVAEAYEYVVQLRLYEGAKKRKQFDLFYFIGIRRKLCSAADGMLKTPTISFDIFMDYYLTSFRLLSHFGVNNIWTTGVLKKIDYTNEL